MAALASLEHRIWLGTDQSESAPRLWVMAADSGAELEVHAGPVGARVSLEARHCLELGALLTLIGLRCSGTAPDASPDAAS